MPQKPAILEFQRTSSVSVRILLADDFEPWRAHVRSFLQRETKWQIIEAWNGHEAVQKAIELHPDVVLLDIAMPGLNGIEAAKRIRQLSPSSRIVFLTENTDEDVRRAALETGAVAYVLKTETATDLVPAIQAALVTDL